MKWIIWFILVGAGLILLLSIVLFFYQTDIKIPLSLEEEIVVHETQLAKEGQGVIYAIVLDMDNSGRLDHITVEKGQDAFLGIKANAKILGEAATTKQEFYVFNGVDSLAKYDSNGDGWINESDPVFGELELLTRRRFTGGTNVALLKNVGISALFFDPTYLAALKKGTAKKEHQVIGYAVMSDSSQRMMKVIPMPLNLLTR